MHPKIIKKGFIICSVIGFLLISSSGNQINASVPEWETSTIETQETVITENSVAINEEEQGNKQPLSESHVSIEINGKKVTDDQPPVIEEGRTLVPIRHVVEALGAKVNWQSASKTVDISLNDMSVNLYIGSTETLVNGKPIIIDVPAKIINGRTMVPIRFVAETFGAEVVWNEETKTVYVNG